VDSANGSPISGVTVSAHDASGSTTGSLYYHNSATNQYSSLLSSTSSSGKFVVFNVDIGRVNITCNSGADGNLFVHSQGYSASIVTLGATPNKNTVSWSGVTFNLGASGSAVQGAAEGSVTYELIGTGGSTGPSAANDGSFSIGTVNARNDFYVKCSKSGFIDSYNWKRTEGSNISTGSGGDLLIVDSDNLDELVPGSVTITSGTGMIRGAIGSTVSGLVVQAFDFHGTQIGVVRYGDNSDNGRPNDALTSTQSNGIFYVYNLPPGKPYLLCASKTGYATSAYVDVFGDSITLPRDLVPLAATQATIQVSGVLMTLQNVVLEDGTVNFLGTLLIAPSDSIGAYSQSSVPAKHVFILGTFADPPESLTNE